MLAYLLQVDYVIWTGDLVPHDVWNRSREKNLEIINYTTRVLAESLPVVRVFPAIGNHEAEPVNWYRTLVLPSIPCTAPDPI